MEAKKELQEQITIFVKAQLAKWMEDGIFKSMQTNIDDGDEIFGYLYLSQINGEVVVDGTEGLHLLSTLSYDSLKNIYDALSKGEFK